MTGGGNVGDTYPEADTDRWQLISALGYDNIYNCRLVMLPQSIHYKSQARLNLAVKGYRHRNLTMMLRDNESLQFAQEKFTLAKNLYVPDAAFMLGPLLPNADPVVDVMFLIRQDFESAIQSKAYDLMCIHRIL
jgi:exopolysaccharide biosynthesis predicted pyruvyltransferase EpsI